MSSLAVIVTVSSGFAGVLDPLHIPWEICTGQFCKKGFINTLFSHIGKRCTQDTFRFQQHN